MLARLASPDCTMLVWLLLPDCGDDGNWPTPDWRSTRMLASPDRADRGGDVGGPAGAMLASLLLLSCVGVTREVVDNSAGGNSPAGTVGGTQCRAVVRRRPARAGGERRGTRPWHGWSSTGHAVSAPCAEVRRRDGHAGDEIVGFAQIGLPSGQGDVCRPSSNSFCRAHPCNRSWITAAPRLPLTTASCGGSLRE